MANPNSVLARIFSWDIAALVLRLMIFLMFVYHGSQKMFGWFGGPGFEKVVGMFEGRGIPAPLAMAVPVTEFVGGCCVLLGLLTRFWSAGHAIIMINAIVLVHAHDAWNPAGPSISLPLMTLGLSLALFLGGPGRYAIADWEGRLLGVRK